MATEKNESVFTNTRLMLAGVIAGVLGVLLAFMYIHKKVEESTGEMVDVYYLSKNVSPLDKVTADCTYQLKVPKEAAMKMVKLTEWNLAENQPPNWDLEKDEPLLLRAFDPNGRNTASIKPSKGCVIKVVMVNPSTSQGVTVGTIVNLTANYDFNARRGSGTPDPMTLKILDRVQVKSVNGLTNPPPKELKSIKTIGLDLDEEVAEKLKMLERYQEGFYDMDSKGTDVLRTDPKDQIPADIMNRIQEKLKQLVEKPPAKP
jgi:hypothetical protein